MKCPFCLHEDDKVIDSRSSNEGKSVRRRRECLKCKKRFTTYEYIEEVPLMVIKKDGRRESGSHDLTEKFLQPLPQAPATVALLELSKTLNDLVERTLMESLRKQTVVVQVRDGHVRTPDVLRPSSLCHLLGRGKNTRFDVIDSVGSNRLPSEAYLPRRSEMADAPSVSHQCRRPPRNGGKPMPRIRPMST